LRITQNSGWPVAAFFAGFCLIANGAYLGMAVGQPVGDAADLLRMGTPLWLLAGFALVTIPAGFWLWNGLGRHFGLGPESNPVSQTQGVVLLIALVIVLVAETALSVAA
jgi:hypothetical protein